MTDWHFRMCVSEITFKCVEQKKRRLPLKVRHSETSVANRPSKQIMPVLCPLLASTFKNRVAFTNRHAGRTTSTIRRTTQTRWTAVNVMSYAHIPPKLAWPQGPKGCRSPSPRSPNPCTKCPNILPDSSAFSFKNNQVASYQASTQYAGKLK